MTKLFIRLDHTSTNIDHEVADYCKMMDILNNSFPAEECDRIFTSLVAVFGAEATLNTITRTAV